MDEIEESGWSLVREGFGIFAFFFIALCKLSGINLLHLSKETLFVRL